MRPSCTGRLVATISAIGDMTRPALSGHYARTIPDDFPFDDNIPRILRHLWPHSSMPRVVSKPNERHFRSATTLLLNVRYVLVPRHEPLSVLMPPHRNFFVLCLDAARSQHHLVNHRKLTNCCDSRGACPTIYHLGGTGVQMCVGADSRRFARSFAARCQYGLHFDLTIWKLP